MKPKQELIAEIKAILLPNEMEYFSETRAWKTNYNSEALRTIGVREVPDEVLEANEPKERPLWQRLLLGRHVPGTIAIIKKDSEINTYLEELGESAKLEFVKRVSVILEDDAVDDAAATIKRATNFAESKTKKPEPIEGKYRHYPRLMDDFKFQRNNEMRYIHKWRKLFIQSLENDL